MPNDNGNLLLTEDEKIEILILEPNSKKWIKPLLSAKEYLNGKKKWCLWLDGIQPNELKAMPEIYKRVNLVKKHRGLSNRLATQKLAFSPHLFGEIRQPKSNYIFVPLTSTENREYIPFDFIDKTYIANNSCSVIPNASIFHFGILTSKMHMTWMRYVCGRLESRYRYSNEIVYNNFPWPNDANKVQKKAIENAAQKVLDIRKTYFKTGSSLVDLYDSIAMPVNLLKAHQALDNAVDKFYRETKFTTDQKRLEYLFNLYEDYNANLFTEIEKPERKVKKKKV